ncbi:hypothetical protein SAY87_032277 [Trapa incisa]|uniref:Uncharacterized protein n=1 Tax=Trapa incisa TaxID=236973 RepID=A0AAN7JFK5_9MYRT|nr:hypothetical protein SAY87_032277 [Trapa incisa]
MEQCRQGKSAKWIRNLGKGLALRAGHGGPSPEPVGCWWTARAALVARAGHCVPAGGRTGNGSFGGLPRASNSRLRTAKPQPRERAWQNQRGKKTLLSLTLVRLCEMT